MNYHHVAVWILGPVGAGKSTLSKSFAALGFSVIDQDRDAEAAMRRLNLSLNTRVHSPEQAEQFKALREQVADKVWLHVKQLRASGTPLLCEATGNKPHYLEAEVRSDRAAGYRVAALGLNTPRLLCQQRNAARERVLSSELVDSTWDDFQRSVQDSTYQNLFGAPAFELIDGTTRFEAERWLARVLGAARRLVP